MASIGIASGPWVIAKPANSPDRAPVGPTILKLLPPKIEAIKPAHIAVKIPIAGDTCDATASETESGIDTIATVIPERKFDFIF